VASSQQVDETARYFITEERPVRVIVGAFECQCTGKRKKQVVVARHRAIIAVGHMIRAQATIMGYADSFALIGVVLLTGVLAVMMLRKGVAAGGAVH
jgi:acyl-CoA thioesterase